MTPLVSIVVTVYQKQDYLERTLRSVLATSYPNKEIIVVDDCSTDGGPEIVARFAAGHPDLVVVRHETNRGLSAARNTGLERATGKYVQFWDADDLLDPEGLKKVVREMEEDGSDIGTGIAFRNGRPLRRYAEAMLSVRATDLARTPVAAHNASTCFKIYRKGFLDEHGLLFVPGLYMQDIEFNLRAMPLAASITVTPHCLGDYLITENAGSRSFSQPRYDSAFEIDRLTRAFYAERSLTRWERFRQDRVLTAVFFPFLRHALHQIRESYRFTEGHSHCINRPARAWHYIERFREAVADFGEGIRAVFERNPGIALGYVGLREGSLDQVLPLLHGTKPNPGFPKYFPSTDVLTRQQILDSLPRLGDPTDKFAWRPMC